MDNRKALLQGTILDFQGIPCEIMEEIGRGSNSLVYRGRYRDALEKDISHYVIIKELFPLDIRGRIHRQENGTVLVEHEAAETFQLHKSSFEYGNSVHLTLLESYPDQVGTNLNTYTLNGTLYSVLGISGGESLIKARIAKTRSLKSCVMIILAILDALEVFHNSGLLHLDISPDNIILLGKGNQERALLIDYNSVVPVAVNARQDPVVFSLKQGYTAPEIRSGRSNDISYSADLYSVTAVFYWLITGSPLTNFQMIRSLPPDVSDNQLVYDEPETVKAWVREILKHGLQTLPSRRYQSVAMMRRDFQELLDRIAGIGITHWALWESGQRQVRKVVQQNPSLGFINDTATLFPLQLTDGKESFSAEEYLIKAENNIMLIAGGGMGKTTSLMRIALSGIARYKPEDPAIIYLSLYGWQNGNDNYIINSILEGLRFHPDTRTYDDARKALFEVLDCPIKGNKPVVVLLLDGLNEVMGDKKQLIDEIKRISLLRGVRLVVSSRVDEKALNFQKFSITELSDEVIDEALSSEGLLIPEKKDIKELLRIPIMLSMYIKTGQINEGQVNAQSSDELISLYLTALKSKAIRDIPEQTDRRWQIDAAVDYVLPSIASAINREQRGLNDAELLGIVGKCYKLLKGRLSRRFFPQWIGHTAAIRGEATNGEEWYGQILHDILWKQLGLVTVDEQGRYNVSHQMIGDYLEGLDKANRQKIRKYHITRAALVFICLFIAAASSITVYRNYIALPPYNELYADNVMERAVSAYVSAGKQYELLSDLTECAIDSPEEFGTQLNIYKSTTPYHGMSIENSKELMFTMLETGKVMPWSNLPIDENAYIELLSLSENREEEYAFYALVLEYVMIDDLAFRLYGKEFPTLLAALLETDADIAAELFKTVCAPHMTGKYADNSVTADAFNSLLASVPKQNEHISDGSTGSSGMSLVRLQGNRQNQLIELNKCGAFKAYELSNDK